MSWAVRMASRSHETPTREDRFTIQATGDRRVYLWVEPDESDDPSAASAPSGQAGGTVAELIAIVAGNLVRPDVTIAKATMSRLEIEPSGETVALPAIKALDAQRASLTLTGITVLAAELVDALHDAIELGMIGAEWKAAISNGVLYMAEGEVNAPSTRTTQFVNAH